MRLMSVSLTEQAVVERRKTVTRRMGWEYLKPGDHVELCRKVMGRRPDEPLVRICQVRIVDVRRVRLDTIDAADVTREGLNMTPAEFVDFFVSTHKGCDPTSTVTRIEWEYA